jgi:hypothetical protein
MGVLVCISRRILYLQHKVSSVYNFLSNLLLRCPEQFVVKVVFHRFTASATDALFQ